MGKQRLFALQKSNSFGLLLNPAFGEFCLKLHNRLYTIVEKSVKSMQRHQS